MPKIDELKIKSLSKKFKKTSYRPWDEINEKAVNSTQNNINNCLLNIEPISSNFNNLNLENDLEKKFRHLHGLQYNILLYLQKKIIKQDETFSYTSPIYYSDIIEYTHSLKSSVTTSLTRLKNKGLLYSVETKPGRGGFAMYKITNKLYNLLNKKMI